MVIGGLGLVPLNDKVGAVLVSADNRLPPAWYACYH